jgi:hypothetical protein
VDILDVLKYLYLSNLHHFANAISLDVIEEYLIEENSQEGVVGEDAV